MRILIGVFAFLLTLVTLSASVATTVLWALENREEVLIHQHIQDHALAAREEYLGLLDTKLKLVCAEVRAEIAPLKAQMDNQKELLTRQQAQLDEIQRRQMGRVN